MDQARARVIVSGRVQGVFFRQSAATEARARDLAGWVRNLPDGRVEAVFQGDRAAVEELLAWCRSGPPAARVFDTQIAWEAPGEAPSPFSVAG